MQQIEAEFDRIDSLLHGDLIEKGRDLTLANALNGDVDHPGALRLRRDRVAALG